MECSNLNQTPVEPQDVLVLPPYKPHLPSHVLCGVRHLTECLSFDDNGDVELNPKAIKEALSMYMNECWGMSTLCILVHSLIGYGMGLQHLSRLLWVNSDEREPSSLGLRL